MLDYQSTDECRMTFLRRQLDDPELGDGERCGRCDNCAGAALSAPRSTPAPAEATRERLMRPGVEITPRKQWPSGLAQARRRPQRPIADGPAPGRVIGRLTDLGWGARLRRLLDEPDGEVPDGRRAGGGRRCSPPGTGQTRPTAVMALDSDTPSGPDRVRWRAAGRARRLTDLGTLRYAAGAPAGHRGQLRLPRRRARRIVVGAGSVGDRAAGGPVLLVDDLTDTGWTLTMAARVVRAAGAPDVLPFALAGTS